MYVRNERVRFAAGSGMSAGSFQVGSNIMVDVGNCVSRETEMYIRQAESAALFLKVIRV